MTSTRSCLDCGGRTYARNRVCRPCTTKRVERIELAGGEWVPNGQGVMVWQANTPPPPEPEPEPEPPPEPKPAPRQRRRCPDCGQELPKNRRYCDDCRIERRRQNWREGKRYKRYRDEREEAA